MTQTLTTYRITDDRATVRERPFGKQIRHMALDEMFQGRPAPDDPDWIMRVDDDGVTARGYVKASLCGRLDMPASMRMPEDFPPPSAVGDTVDHLASWLAFGRSRERARAIRALFGDFAAAVINAAASQAASVATHLLERQVADRAEIARLRARIEALEATRERTVGGE